LWPEYWPEYWPGCGVGLFVYSSFFFNKYCLIFLKIDLLLKQNWFFFLNFEKTRELLAGCLLCPSGF
jgi:hypothetical protein